MFDIYLKECLLDYLSTCEEEIHAENLYLVIYSIINHNATKNEKRKTTIFKKTMVLYYYNIKFIAFYLKLFLILYFKINDNNFFFFKCFLQ